MAPRGIALNQEVEQAAAALAAEKEKRHAAEEAYADAKDALVALRKKPQIPSSAIEEVPIEKHAVVTKGPDLPVTILHGPQALTRKEIDYLAPVLAGTGKYEDLKYRRRTG